MTKLKESRCYTNLWTWMQWTQSDTILKLESHLHLIVGTIQFVTTLQVCLNDYTDGTVFLFEFLTVNSYFLITSPNVMSGFITFGSAWASLGEKSVLLNIPCCGRGVTTLLYPRVSTRLLPSIENLPCLKHSEVLVRLRGPLLLVLVPSLLKLPNGRIYRVPWPLTGTYFSPGLRERQLARGKCRL